MKKIYIDKTGIIYCYTNLINGKRYIGQTWHPVKRKNQHKRSAENLNNANHNQPFHLALAKYGWDNFYYSVLVADINIQEDMDSLEVYYIQYHHSLTTENGYNVTTGGSGHWSVTSEAAARMCMAKAGMTKEEVIQLRIAYKNHESPVEIYNIYYKDRCHFNAFLNIWAGQRYKHILPGYIETGRRTKHGDELVQQIRTDYATGQYTYKQLGEKYNIPEGTIGNIMNEVTHKIKKSSEPVTTIPESGK